MAPSTNPSNSPFDIAVIGGGIAGLTLAIALLKRGIKVDIYEQAKAYGEIGAGVGFSPNAAQAMEVCSDGIFQGFDRVRTRNLWPSKQKLWFTYVDGFNHDESMPTEKYLFDLGNDVGQNAVHRAHFLEEMIKLVPESVSHFRKHLDNVEEDANGKLKMTFHDGSEAFADAVIGCDGIKSRVRQLIVGEDHPSAHPQYTHKYCYRGLIPIEEAKEAIGEEMAANSTLHMGPGRHILTFPVNRGETMNVVAFCTNADDWPDYTHLTRPAKKSDALKEFEDWGTNPKKIMSLLKEDLDVWAIFDLGDHPLSTYHKNRIVVVGDAAHATSPHHGAGAGFCIEDSAVLAEILGAVHGKLQGTADKKEVASTLETAFVTYEAARKERSQWLVQSSRRTGNLYEWADKECGDDVKKIEEVLKGTHHYIWDVSVREMCNDAVADFEKRLAA